LPILICRNPRDARAGINAATGYSRRRGSSAASLKS
jgi:hypothetical protein